MDVGCRDIFNSGATQFGGWNVGNYSQVVNSRGGHFEASVPAAALVVFRKE